MDSNEIGAMIDDAFAIIKRGLKEHRPPPQFGAAVEFTRLIAASVWAEREEARKRAEAEDTWPEQVGDKSSE